MRRIFVDKEINITQGPTADRMIAEKNEVQYFEKGIGIRRVDQRRWNEAQHYERKTWCDSPATGMTADHNYEHMLHFNDYAMLNDLLDDNLSVIELGCGPFTNMRLILRTMCEKRIAHVSLLDPLISEYLLHAPNCTYRKGLDGLPVKTHNCPIEDFEIDRQYDLVVMINVLEHCFNTDRIFENIRAMLKTGGILVIGERVFAGMGEGMLQSLEEVYDAGHPIRLSEMYFNSKIMEYEELYSNEYISDFVISKYKILRKQ